MSRIEAGRVLQTRGPAMLNDRSPIAVRDLRTSSRATQAEHMPVRCLYRVTSLSTWCYCDLDQRVIDMAVTQWCTRLHACQGERHTL